MVGIREGTFFIGGGGGPGLRRGGSLVIFLQIGEGQKNVLFSTGGGSQFFGKEQITPCRFYFVYASKATSQD